MGLVRRSCLGALLVPVICLVIVLAVIGVAADRVSLWVAEHVVASQVQKAGGQDVAVTAYGFPFLTQALHRDLDHVRVTASSVSHNGLVGDDMHLDLHGVRPESRTAVDVASLTGDAVVPWSEIDRRAKLPAGSLAASGSRVRITRTTKVLGRSVKVTGLAAVSVGRGNRVTVRVTSLQIPGLRLSRPVLSAVQRQLVVVYPVRGLPAGVTLVRSEVVPTGVRVHVTGRDARLTR